MKGGGSGTAASGKLTDVGVKLWRSKRAFNKICDEKHVFKQPFSGRLIGFVKQPIFIDYLIRHDAVFIRHRDNYAR